MKLLAIETATEACSVALAVDGDVREQFEVAPRGHAGRVLPMAQALLAEAGLGLRQLDALVFGRGPGAFTGLRIAAGVTQGLAFGAGLPVVPVSSLATLAQGIAERRGAGNVLAAFDARMGEVYWGAFRREGDIMQALGAEHVCDASQVAVEEGSRWFGAGSGWRSDGDALQAVLGDALDGYDADCYPAARHALVAGAAAYAAGAHVDAARALPVYLRDRVAWQKTG